MIVTIRETVVTVSGSAMQPSFNSNSNLPKDSQPFLLKYIGAGSMGAAVLPGIFFAPSPLDLDNKTIAKTYI